MLVKEKAERGEKHEARARERNLLKSLRRRRGRRRRSEEEEVFLVAVRAMFFPNNNERKREEKRRKSGKNLFYFMFRVSLKNKNFGFVFPPF